MNGKLRMTVYVHGKNKDNVGLPPKVPQSGRRTFAG